MWSYLPWPSSSPNNLPHDTLKQLHPLPSPPPPAAGMGASVFLAEAVYGVAPVIILDSARRAIDWWDIVTSMIK